MAISHEALDSRMESAYFESFSGENPLLDTPLPNTPDWTTFKPDHSRYALSIGMGILDNNMRAFEEKGLEVPHESAQLMIQGMLGLDKDELDRFMGKRVGQERDVIPAETLEERFFVARYLSDVLNKKFSSEIVSGLLRKPAPLYEGRNMIEMVGDGEGVLLVGVTDRSFDWGRTA
ncbi:hypothetical protein E6Q11_00575 [Candidatus Dojkabacteria bacterium]|uniref:Uncharacterized protein n=1 Tax=Candidatus Dojkabacteria bacterium TaxID=2099670 RepID=A0A5C7JC39_9BACT|nr:MAG: hypothetical protein E6Q11_00575 [Candidatus Dojkabacteria bacterium]